MRQTWGKYCFGCRCENASPLIRKMPNDILKKILDIAFPLPGPSGVDFEFSNVTSSVNRSRFVLWRYGHRENQLHVWCQQNHPHYSNVFRSACLLLRLMRLVKLLIVHSKLRQAESSLCNMYLALLNCWWSCSFSVRLGVNLGVWCDWFDVTAPLELGIHRYCDDLTTLQTMDRYLLWWPNWSTIWFARQGLDYFIRNNYFYSLALGREIGECLRCIV